MEQRVQGWHDGVLAGRRQLDPCRTHQQRQLRRGWHGGIVEKFDWEGQLDLVLPPFLRTPFASTTTSPSCPTATCSPWHGGPTQQARGSPKAVIPRKRQTWCGACPLWRSNPWVPTAASWFGNGSPSTTSSKILTRRSPNHGDPKTHPRQLDVNYEAEAGDCDWLHSNSIAYNAELDQSW